MAQMPKSFQLSDDYYLVPAHANIQPILIHASCSHSEANKNKNPHFVINWIDFTKFWPGADNYSKCNCCKAEVPSDVLNKARFIISGTYK